MSYPIKWNPAPKELEEKRQKLFDKGSSLLNGLISEPYGLCCPPPMTKVAERIYNFKVRPDDIWIITYPKCGTTWMQELVWQIVNNVDTETAKKVPLWVRTPFLEIEGLWTDDPSMTEGDDFSSGGNDFDPKMMEAMHKSIDHTENLPSPRVIKSHFPIEMLPPNLLDTCKVIFISRNPKDCCVSYYNHFLNFPEYKFKGEFADYAQLFLEGTIEYGSYWTMLKSAYKFKNHPNMKLLWYEDMKKDLVSVIKEVASFTGYHMTQLKILQLDDFLYIDNFRQVFTEGFGGDPHMKKFIRKGKIGDWKNYFNEDNSKVWDKWIADNLAGTDIVLPEY